MFDKLKSVVTGSSGPKAGVQVAMPLFSAVTVLPAEAVVSAWSRLFPGQPGLSFSVTEAGGPVSYAMGDRSVQAVWIPVPIPGDEVLHAVPSSWMWQIADDSLRQHRAHAIVAAAGPGDPLARAWDVTRLSAAMLSAVGGVGLYWGASRQVHAPDVVETFVTKEKPPVPLWVGITISGKSAAGPFSAATHGLEAFGQKELEVLGTRMAVGELRMTLLNLASYVLQRGSMLKDGETCGPSATVRWTVRHRPSKLVPGREVIVIECLDRPRISRPL
jgi:hypothetical protein